MFTFIQWEVIYVMQFFLGKLEMIFWFKLFNDKISGHI